MEYGVGEDLGPFGGYADATPLLLDDRTRLPLGPCEKNRQPHRHRLKDLGRNDGLENWIILEMNQRDIAEPPVFDDAFFGLRRQHHHVRETPFVPFAQEFLALRSGSYEEESNPTVVPQEFGRCQDSFQGMGHPMSADVPDDEFLFEPEFSGQLHVFRAWGVARAVHAIANHGDLRRIDPTRDEVLPKGSRERDDLCGFSVETQLHPLDPA